jgi:hypothetical protein
MSEPPPSPPGAPGGPAPGWWQASDGKWYPPDQQPGYAGPPSAYGAPGYGAPGYGPPPGYAPPGFAQPVGYGYGYGAPVARTTNGTAIAALVLGCSQFIVWILATIPAIICGHVALAQIKRTGQDGRGMAIAGLVLGYLGLVMFVAFVVLLVVVADETDDNGFRFESGMVLW